jgi:hypothetical protein
MPQTAAGQGQGPHGHQQHRFSLPQVSTGSAPLTITGKPLIERGDQMQEHFQVCLYILILVLL